MSAFPLGDGIFETIKTYSGKPALLDLHLERAENSAKRLNLKMLSRDLLRNQVFEYLCENPVESAVGRLRIEIHSDESIDLSHSPYISWENPARLTVTNSKIDERTNSAGIKVLPYVQNLALLERAKEAGYDEVIRFNTRNEICEGATSNLLLKISGIWSTPDLSSGCLPGITRGLCLEWFSVKERKIHRDELADVESVFILSSLRGVQPASTIGPHELLIETAMEIEANARLRALSIE